MDSPNLRGMYDKMKLIEIEEKRLKNQIRSLTTEKTEIRKNIQIYMETTNLQMLGVSGTPESIELVEQKKFETLTKDNVIKKIIHFFNTIGTSQQYQLLEPNLQAEALIHSIYTERDFTIVKKLKFCSDQHVRNVQNIIEQEQNNYDNNSSSTLLTTSNSTTSTLNTNTNTNTTTNNTKKKFKYRS